MEIKFARLTAVTLAILTGSLTYSHAQEGESAPTAQTQAASETVATDSTFSWLRFEAGAGAIYQDGSSDAQFIPEIAWAPKFWTRDRFSLSGRVSAALSRDPDDDIFPIFSESLDVTLCFAQRFDVGIGLGIGHWLENDNQKTYFLPSANIGYAFGGNNSLPLVERIFFRASAITATVQHHQFVLGATLNF